MALRFAAILIYCLYCDNSGTARVQAQTHVLDVKHYRIDLDISNLSSRSIRGFCELELACLQTHSVCTLYLQGLQVDSIVPARLISSYTHDGMYLNIHWDTEFTVSDTARTIRVYYGGEPIQDPSWGGFYFNGDYAFNMGVGFDSDPHNFGRVWFPCVDNFTDRATYYFVIKTQANNRAMCNGLLQKEELLPDGKRLFHWKLDVPIPTYLASVAVAPYTVSSFNHKGIPVTLAAVQKDSLNMSNAFRRLPQAIDAFVHSYGTHRFPRIGFNVVPFSSGAMEHATNIAYPLNVLTDVTRAEGLFAHELAHHWWGNNTTCSGAHEMWLNEGWASYSEALFYEYVSGKEAYRDHLRSTQASVLHIAHLRDGDTLALNAVKQESTYGSHSYDKGAVVVACLRGYMGDSAFFKACRSFQENFSLSDVTSSELRDHFQLFTARDLNTFFTYWVEKPGQPHFDILEWSHQRSGDSFDVQVRIRQRLFLAPEMYRDVPLTVRFYKEDLDYTDRSFSVSGSDQIFKFRIAFQPSYIQLDPEESIMDALSDYTRLLDTAGEYDFKEARMKITTNTPNPGALIHVAHHWVGPDRYFVNEAIPVLSRERYWTVGGVWPDSFRADAEIIYNGRKSGVNYPIGYLDDDLIRITEDSLKLYYRPYPSAYWQECPEYEKVMGSKLDRYGIIKIKNLQKGEYALAISDAGLLKVEPEMKTQKQVLKVYPNPAEHYVVLECAKAKGGTLEITDLNGHVVFSRRIDQNNWKLELDTSMLPRGYYLAGIICSGQAYEAKGFFLR